MANPRKNLELDLKTLDPIFTPQFFSFDEKKIEEKEPPLGFSLLAAKNEEDFVNNLPTLLDSPNGREFIAGATDLINKISNVFNDWKEIAPLRRHTWDARLKMLEGRFTCDMSRFKRAECEELYTLFTQGVINLNRILYKIQDKNLLLTLRQTVIGNLLDSAHLLMCPPGVAIFLEDTYQQFKSSVEEKLRAARLTIVKQVAQKLRYEQKSLGGMDTHYAEFLVYSYAHTLGLGDQKLDDPHAKDLLEETEFLQNAILKFPSAFTLESVICLLMKHFNLDNIIQDLQNIRENKEIPDEYKLCLAPDNEEIDQAHPERGQIYVKLKPGGLSYIAFGMNTPRDLINQDLKVSTDILNLADLQKKQDQLIQVALKKDDILPLREIQLSRHYQRQTEQLKKNLDAYGEDQDWDISFYEIDPDSEDFKIKLTQDAHLNLQITLTHRLFAKGYLNTDQRIEIPLSENVSIYILMRENNVTLSYMRLKNQNSIKYNLFLPYFKQASLDEKNKILDKLLELSRNKSLRPDPWEFIKQKLLLLAEQDSSIYLLLLQKEIIPLDEKNKYGLTPIFVAIKNEHLDVIRYLAQHQDISLYQDNNGRTALELAVDEEKLDVIDCLLVADEKQVLVNKKNVYGRTALMRAVEYAKNINVIQIIQRLIQNGVSLYEIDHNGNTVLMHALRYGMNSIIAIKYLIEIDKQGILLFKKNNAGKTPFVSLLEAYRFTYTDKQKDWLETILLLVRNMARFREEIDMTDSNSDTELMHLILQTTNNCTADIKLVKCLIEADKRLLIQKNNNGDTPLSLAIKSQCDINIIERLIQADTAGASLTMQNKEGDTPLLVALKLERIEIIQALLMKTDKTNRSLTLPNNAGDTPLFIITTHLGNARNYTYLSWLDIILSLLIAYQALGKKTHLHCFSSLMDTCYNTNDKSSMDRLQQELVKFLSKQAEPETKCEEKEAFNVTDCSTKSNISSFFKPLEQAPKHKEEDLLSHLNTPTHGVDASKSPKN